MSEGKWEVVKPVAKHHPRKDAVRKRALEQQQQKEQMQQQQKEVVMSAALAQALAPRTKGLQAPGANGTFSVAVDKSKMPKSVIKSIEKDAKKKKEKRPNKSGAPKKDSVAVAAPVFDPTSLRQKASKLTGSAVRDELAQVLIEYPNAVSAWPIRVAEIIAAVFDNEPCVISLDSPLDLIDQEAHQQLLKFLRDRIPVANRAAQIAFYFAEGGATMQLLLQIVAQAWPEQLMAALADEQSAFSEIKSLSLGALLANPKMASRGSLVWLQQFVRFSVDSEAHLLCLSRIKQFSDSRLTIDSVNSILESSHFASIVPHLPAHPEIFAQMLPLMSDKDYQKALLPVVARHLVDTPQPLFARWRQLAAVYAEQTGVVLQFLSLSASQGGLNSIRSQANSLIEFVRTSLPDSAARVGAEALSASLSRKPWLSVVGSFCAVACAAAIIYAKYTNLI